MNGETVLPVVDRLGGDIHYHKTLWLFLFLIIFTVFLYTVNTLYLAFTYI